jgi:HAD superfamily hydrolase (TIGR01459 family)
MPRLLAGVRALVDEFDDFLVDLWGVVHDGEQQYEGVSAALEALARAQKRVLFVTNTSRTGDAVIDSLVAKIGIDRALFADVVSSGDVTQAALQARDRALFERLSAAPRCFHYGDAAYVPWLFETGLEMVEAVESAELVVVSGAPREAAELARVRALLAPAAARGLRLVCTNPDHVIPSAAGVSLGPGAVARAYAELGGPVFAYGKPHRPIYEEARRRLGSGPVRRGVAIGDRLETDIRGACAAGIPSVLVARGGEARTSEGIAPDMVIARFAW